MAEKRKSRRKTEEPPPPPPRWQFGRLLKGFLGIAFLAAVVLGVGSYFIRKEVIRRVKDESLTSNAGVFSRPYPLMRGLNLERTKTFARLDRLAYHKIAADPQHPGEYSLRGDKMLIYLRGTNFGGEPDQPPAIIELKLSSDKEIQEITDSKFQRPINQAYLEPELLSLLGDSATRASTPKQLSEFPPKLINAVLAIEDERFYRHYGIDPIALLRAMVVNFSSGHFLQGGSTITQQLSKNLFFTRERTLLRKVFEAFSAILVETAFTKDQILELYLNEVFLAQEGNVAIQGFGEAAQAFFGKDVKDISLAEAATLAGMVKAPTKLSPRLYPKESKKRRQIVLDKMLELGFITPEEKTRAGFENLEVRAAERSKRVAPYFVDFIRRKMQEHFQLDDLASSKLQIITGLDIEYQKCADQAVEAGLKRIEQTYPRLTRSKEPLQVALISVSPVHGEVLAWVGGRDYSENQFDRVSQSKRQPGSAFKPFVYLTALDKNLNSYRVARTTSILSDEPMSVPVAGGKVWQPKNYEDGFRGDVTVREALTFSLNIPTVQLALKVGIDSVARTAERFGFGENLPRVPSLALGAGEVSPFDLSRAYAALANGGVLINLKPIVAVMNENDPVPISKPESKEERIAGEAPVYVLTNMMQSVIESGTGQTVRRLGFTAPAAGKTGTSSDSRDAWFAGFTPRLLTVVWVGFDDNKETKLTGGQAAAPIWTEFMKCAAPLEPQLDFVVPPGVAFRDIDQQTGLLFTPYCPVAQKRTEVFVDGTEPVTPCTQHAREGFQESGLPPAREAGGETWSFDKEDNGREVLSPPSSSSGGRRGLWDKIFGE